MRLVFVKTRSEDLLIKTLNGISTGFVHLGPPQWNGSKWVAWGRLTREGMKLVSTGKLKIGDIDK